MRGERLGHFLSALPPYPALRVRYGGSALTCSGLKSLRLSVTLWPSTSPTSTPLRPRGHNPPGPALRWCGRYGSQAGTPTPLVRLRSSHHRKARPSSGWRFGVPVDPSCRRGVQATPPPSPSGRAVAPAFGQPRCLCPQRGPSSASGLANAGAVVFIGYRLPMLLLGLWRVVALLTACRQPRAPSCGRGPRLTTRSGATTSPSLVVCAKVLATAISAGLLGWH